MARIKYVGLKQSRADTVAGTGLVWQAGETHEVSDPAKVSALLKHPHIWQLEDGEAPPVVEKTVAKTEDGKKEDDTAGKKPEDAKPPRVPLPHLDGMKKDELRIFAQQWYGENLHPNMSEANMRAKVQALIQERGRD